MKKSFAERTFWVCIKTAVVSVFLISFLGCSAYFNTYYNGNNAFKEARLLHQKTEKKFPDSLLVSAPQDAVTKYERAIQKSTKIIDAFPKKKKWHDDALILIGKSYYYKKDFSKAIRRFKELQASFPLSLYVPESYVFLAMCYIEDGSYDKAEESLEYVLNKYPLYNNNQKITMLLVEIAVRREGRSEAIVLLEKSLKEAKTDPERIEIIIRISQLYIDMKQHQKALSVILSAPKKRKNTEQAYRLDKNQIICLKELGKLDDALKLIGIMSSRDAYAVHSDEISYEKGLIFKNLTRYDDAIDVFKHICKDSDTLKIRTDTSSFKGKAYYQLGLIYQIMKRDFKKAKEYYSLASNSMDTSVKTIASRRVTAMKTLDSLRNVHSQKTDSQSVIDRRMIKICELFRFDLEEPDSAFNEYMKIANDTMVEKETGAKALCAAALICRENQKDSVLADSLFNSVLKKYSDTRFAQLAQKELKIEVTIMTREDSANAAYRKAEQLFYDENNVKGAIHAFFEIYKSYPELDIAPKSLYAAAYFSDNVLLKKSTAKGLYEKICEKYKQSDYCKGANIRVKTVTDTLVKLDELRKKNEQRKKLEEKKSAVSSKSQKDSAKVKPAVAVTDSLNVKTTPAEGTESDDLLDDDEKDNSILPDTSQNDAIKTDSLKVPGGKTP